MQKAYYLDSYALIEIAKGNPNYADYTKLDDATTSKLNLLEMRYILSEQMQEDLAEQFYRIFSGCVADSNSVLSDEILKKAADFRLKIRGASGRKFSYIDAVGYVYAVSSGLTFLTGAREFEGFQGVEIVR